MNRQQFFIILTIISLLLPLWGGGSELSELDCGSVRGEFYYYLDMFSGWHGSGGSAGQFRENPALIKGEESGKFSLCLSPEISFKVGTFYSDYETKINAEIDELVESVASDTMSVGYPELNLKGGQQGGIKELTLGIPAGKGYWGVSLWRPFQAGIKLNASSIFMMLRSDAGLKEEETKVVLGNDLSAEISVELNQTRIGYSRSWQNGLTLGAGLDIVQVGLRAEGASNTEGFIRQYGGDTDISEAFNDPEAGMNYRNSLDNWWSSDFEEVMIGFNAGLAYQVSPTAALDLGFCQPYLQELTGESQGVVRTLGAVDYDAIGDGEGELFDELLLEPSRLTYTNETQYICRSLVMQYPGLIRLGIGFEQGTARHQINMATYLGELSFRYKGEVNENGRERQGSEFVNYERSQEVDYTWGVRLKSRLEYNLSFELSSRVGSYLSLAYYNMEEVSENISSSSEERSSISLVTGNLGLSWELMPSLEAEFLVVGFPGAIWQMRLNYNFGVQK